MELNRAYSIKKILRLKDKIATDIDVLGFLGSVPKGKDFEEFVRCVVKAMPKSVKREAVGESLTALAGQPLTQELLAEYAWRLAANQNKLIANTPIMPWTSQRVGEWLPIHLTGARREFSATGKPLVRYTALILAGSPAGAKIEKVWPSRFLPLLSRYVGFGRLDSEYPYSHFLQMVGMRMKVLFDPALSQGRPAFDKVRQTQPPSLIEWNRMLLNWRARRTFKCPKKYPVDVHPCHLCHVGLDQCQAAVHPKTYRMEVCRKCDKQKFHDPASTSKICMDCEYQKLKGEQRE